MATVFKPKGRRRYYIAYRDAFGIRQTKSSGTSDRQAAERIANKLEAEQALRREGVIDVRLEAQVREAAKPIKGVIEAFWNSLAATGKDEKYVSGKVKYIELIVKDCGAGCLQDINADGVNAFLNRLRSKGMGERTVGAYVQAIKQLTRWAIKTGKLAVDPLASVSKPQADIDPKRIRDYLTHEEWTWLDTITRRSPTRFGMTGQERAVLYSLAIQTGLRVGECRALTRGKLQLNEADPYVVALARDTKNKKPARQYIKTELAKELDALVGLKNAGALVFAIPHKAADMLREDLADARAAWLKTIRKASDRVEAEGTDFLLDVDSQGHVLDFHALRHTCATWLIQSGADVKTVQSIMRHSDIKLTLQTYGHLFPGAEATAIRNLQIPGSGTARMKATGTDGRQPTPNQSARAGASAEGAKRSDLTQNETKTREEISDMQEQKSQAKQRGNRIFPMQFKSAPARTRTLDPLIKSQLLYRLSYKGNFGM
jgi:integrase